MGKGTPLLEVQLGASVEETTGEKGTGRKEGRKKERKKGETEGRREKGRKEGKKEGRKERKKEGRTNGIVVDSDKWHWTKKKKGAVKV
jgi:hypothetical protein